MNKFLTKIVGAALGLTLAIGVGVAVGVNQGDSKEVEAAPASDTVTFTSEQWTNNKSWTASSDGSGYDEGSGVKIFKALNGMYLTSPSYNLVTGVSVVYSSNKNAVCTFTTTVNNQGSTNASIAKSKTDQSLSLFTHATGITGAVKIVIGCTTSTMWIKSVTVTYTQASSSDCAEIELTGAPERSIYIGEQFQLGYVAIDDQADDWSGPVTYSVTNEKDSEAQTTTGVISVTAEGVLTALKAGTATVSIQDTAGNASADSKNITVKPDADLPYGNYSVTINTNGKTSGQAFESGFVALKATDDVEHIRYRGVQVDYSDVSVNSSYSTEIELERGTGKITFTNNSNASIKRVTVDYYRYENAVLYVDGIAAEYTNQGTTGGKDATYSIVKVYESFSKESFVIQNDSNSYSQNIYSIVVELSYENENEFLDRVILSKDPNTDLKTTYKVNDLPSRQGIIAKAYYKEEAEGEDTRIEDVTSQILSWTYSVEKMTIGLTSFNVTASYNDVDSNTFTVENVVVNDFDKSIENGRYVINNGSVAFQPAEYTNSTSTEVENISSKAWDFTLVGDYEYEVSTTINSVTYYLYCTNDSRGLRSNTYKHTWIIKTYGGGYSMKYDVGSGRYVTYYPSGNDWRSYTSQYEIKLTEEKDMFATNFLSTFTNGCKADGGYVEANMNWAGATTQFGYLSTANQTIFRNATYTRTGSGSSTIVTPGDGVAENVANVVARYDHIINAHGTGTFGDFIGRFTPAGAASVNNVNSTSSTTLVLIVISSISLVAVSSYFVIRRRREN